MTERGHFPKFEEKGPYREVAQRPLVAAPAARVREPKAPVRAKAARPRPQEPATPKVDVGREERAFWRRHSLAARYPRVFALLATAVGGLATWQSLDVLARGGVYRMIGTLGSPAMFLSGLWILAWGLPEDEDGRPPSWWFNGIAACVVVGLGSGVWLLYQLASATAAGH